MTDNERLEFSVLLKDKGKIIIDFILEKKEATIRKMIACDDFEKASKEFYKAKVYDSILTELNSIKNFEEDDKGDK